MALRFEFHPEARLDLIEQLDYVQQKFSLHDSERAFDKVMKGIAQLCDYPETGILMPDVHYNNNEVRILHMRQLSIVYTHDDETLYVVCIWNNYKNPERLSKIIGSR